MHIRGAISALLLGPTNAGVSTAVTPTHLVHLPHGYELVDGCSAYRAFSLGCVVDPPLHAGATEGMATVICDGQSQQRQERGHEFNLRGLRCQPKMYDVTDIRTDRKRSY